jgi:hypothetical protein
MSAPLMLSPELPIRFSGNLYGRGVSKKGLGVELPVVTGKVPGNLVATIPTVHSVTAAGR